MAQKKRTTKKKSPSKKSSAKKSSGKRSTKKSASKKKAKTNKSDKKSSFKKAVKKVKKKIAEIEQSATQFLAPLADEDSLASDILKRVRDALSPSHLSLKNLSAAHKKHAQAQKHGGGHYSLSVVSDMFSGLDLKARQMWVMNLLSDKIGKAIHALQLDLKSPAEVPLNEGSGAPLRRDLKIKPDRPGQRRRREPKPRPTLDEIGESDNPFGDEPEDN